MVKHKICEVLDTMVTRIGEAAIAEQENRDFVIRSLFERKTTSDPVEMNAQEVNENASFGASNNKSRKTSRTTFRHRG